MRIGMLLMGGTYPPDIRVEKEAKTLSASGHEVFLLTSDKDGRPAAEQVGSIAVRRYPARAGFVASKLSALSTLTTWRSPLWERAIEQYVRRDGIEALHVHDLPAVASASAVGRRLGIPVVYDMHENYPAAVGFWDRSTAARIFQTPSRYLAYERDAVNRVDRVVAVVDESRERVVGPLGVNPDNVFVFGNVDDVDAALEWAPVPGAPFTVAYAGGFGPHRGIDTLIRALPILRETIPDARLLLMGAGKGESELHELAESLGLSDAIEWTGWIDGDAMRQRLVTVSVGTVPHLRNAHTDSTVPHKLFQYMAMGLPVMVCDCAPLARIVHETGAGTVARAGDSADIARALVELADESVAKAASVAGKRAVAERYNLAAEGRNLAELYAGLSRKG